MSYCDGRKLRSASWKHPGSTACELARLANPYITGWPGCRRLPAWPQPSDHSDDHWWCSDRYGPRRKDRSYECRGNCERSQKRPDARTRIFVFMLWIGIKAMGHQSLANIVAQSHDDRLIRRVFPQRIPAAHSRNMKKVVRRRRRRHRPFESCIAPWIVSRKFPLAQTANNVSEKDQQPGGHEDHTAGRQYVQPLPMHIRAIGVDATRHAA